MKFFSYNKEIMIATGQMQMLFSNITIKRFPENSDIVVSCVYGQASRILKFLQNPESATYTLPLIVISMGNITRDDSRIANIHANITKTSNIYSGDPNLIPPVNINIKYNISIITKYPNDRDIILSNFITLFNKDVYVTSPHPKLPGRKLHHQLIWDGNINTEWPLELQNSANDFQISNTSFDFKTELFGGSSLIDPDLNNNCILYIDMTLSPASSAHPGTYNLSGGNITGGFYAVPYSEDFVEYANKILNMTYTNPERDDIHYSGLIIASRSGDYDTVTKIVGTDANSINVRDEDQNTPLILASRMGYLTIVEHLLENNATIDDVNKYQNTPLIYSSMFNRDDVFQYLLSQHTVEQLNNIDTSKITNPSHLALIEAAKNP